ncbi:hypothetical protein [Mycobacterium sp.]|uniref:hypothetical protein n=1 Tax=Mycobacterium sp. TaxID=1785 RepID=UPI003F9811E0
MVDALTLPKEGPASANTVIALALGSVTRLAVSLREGRWDDQHAAVTPVTLDRLDAVVRAFGGQPIYGGEFIDPTEELWEHWRERLSLDDVLSPEPSHHVVQLFRRALTLTESWICDCGSPSRASWIAMAGTLSSSSSWPAGGGGGTRFPQAIRAPLATAS